MCATCLCFLPDSQRIRFIRVTAFAHVATLRSLRARDSCVVPCYASYSEGATEGQAESCFCAFRNRLNGTERSDVLFAERTERSDVSEHRCLE